MKYGYVDSSVMARIAFNEPGKIRGLSQFSKLATSELSQVELRRVLDRYRLVTLDAIHLASALIWQELLGQSLTMMTHDRQLAKASKMLNLQVLGV